MEKTAVEWLCHQTELNESTHEDIIWAIKEAKKIHKQQIIDAWDKGDYCIDLPDGSWEQKYKSGEQYYNETFKQQEQ